MRKTVIMLGCAALLSAGAVFADDHVYRVNIRFSNSHADAQSFQRDRDQCFRNTDTYRQSVAEDLRDHAGSLMTPVKTVERHAASFYQCMTARGYRSNPNGPFATSFSSAL